jgi:hypothetical protein
VPALYIRYALFLIEDRAFYTDRVDWAGVRKESLALAGAARSTRDTYPAIRHALSALGDHHSFLNAPVPASGTSPQVRRNRPPSALEVGGWLGIVELPTLPGPSDALPDGRHYADVLHREIARVESLTPRCGWMVDLRQNQGGMGWPMLAAAGPILGEGEAGTWIFRGGARASWSYVSGQALQAEDVIAEVENPHRLAQPSGPVAVLIGARTASAGEFIAMAFKGRPATRFFGEPTAGVPTGNEGISLPDGATLFLTTAIGADRSGRTYEDRILPDMEVQSVSNRDGILNDAVIAAAMEWLLAQPACAAVQQQGRIGLSPN